MVSLVSFFLSVLNNTDDQFATKQLYHYKYTDTVIQYFVTVDTWPYLARQNFSTTQTLWTIWHCFEKQMDFCQTNLSFQILSNVTEGDITVHRAELSYAEKHTII